jgi:hypothetical protein
MADIERSIPGLRRPPRLVTCCRQRPRPIPSNATAAVDCDGRRSALDLRKLLFLLSIDKPSRDGTVSADTWSTGALAPGHPRETTMLYGFESHIQSLFEPSIRAFHSGSGDAAAASAPRANTPVGDAVVPAAAKPNRPARAGLKAMLRAPLGIACLMVAGAAVAQSPATGSARDPDAQLVQQLEQLSHGQLRALYVDCSNEAEKRLLGSGEAAVCSFVYETLKRRVFGGDFDALLAWSRAQRAPQIAARPDTASRPVAAK